jgi:hypothetical protein
VFYGRIDIYNIAFILYMFKRYIIKFLHFLVRPFLFLADIVSRPPAAFLLCY